MGGSVGLGASTERPSTASSVVPSPATAWSTRPGKEAQMPYKTTRPKPTGVPGIRQDGPNRFLVRVRWNDPRTGRRRKREGVAGTLAKAVELQERLKGQEPSPRPTKERFAGYVEQWMRVHGNELAPSTQVRYMEALAHVTVHLGPMYLGSIQPADVREWISRHKKGRANTTSNGWLRVLRRVLDDAVLDGTLPSNPARAVKALKEGRTQGRRGRAQDWNQSWCSRPVWSRHALGPPGGVRIG
jgi:Phage integrase central domain